MCKPEWKDAPEWANYLAMDWIGDWYWYHEKPRLSDSTWETGGAVRLATHSYHGWQQSLEGRPDDT